MLEEAWKQVYVEEPKMSPEEAQKARENGESLQVTTVDGQSFIVAGDDDEAIVDEPNNGLVFHGYFQDQEMSARAEDISMIKSLSDTESIRGGFDPSNPNASLDPSNPDHRLAKIGSDEYYGEENDREEEEDKKKRQTHAWSDESKKYYKKNPPVEEELEEGGMSGHWSQGEAYMALKKLKIAIRDLEPARDIHEWYKDALKAGIDKSVLDKVLDDGFKDEALSEPEVHFIQTGRDDHPDADPSDVGHRGYDKDDKVGEEGCGGPDNEEDRIKRVIIKRIKLMKPESTKVTEGDKKKDKKKEDEKKLKAKMDADAMMAQYGGYDSGS